MSIAITYSSKQGGRGHVIEGTCPDEHPIHTRHITRIVFTTTYLAFLYFHSTKKKSSERLNNLPDVTVSTWQIYD